MKIIYDDGYWWICDENDDPLIGFATDEKAERELEQIFLWEDAKWKKTS